MRVRPPTGEFAVGVSRRARGTFTRPRHDATRHGATLGSVAIAGDGSSGDGSGDRAVVAVLVVYARPCEWFIPRRRRHRCCAVPRGGGKDTPVESAVRG